MTAATDRRRESLAPALAAAAGLHLAALLIILYAPRPAISPMGAAVPITILSSAPTTDSRPAEAAPETQTAQTEAPVPQAKPPAPAPAPPAPRSPPVKTIKPPPTPAPPKPAVEPKPAPPKPRPTPAPTPPRTPPAKPAKDTFSLDALAADVAKSKRPTPPRPAFAARGPARAETAPEARVDAGQGVSQSDIAGLLQLLERLWNPNCNGGGGGGVVIPVKFTVSFDGHVIGRISEGGRDVSSNPVVATAARRAIDAIHQAEPYGEVYRGQTIAVNFDAKTVCANR